MWLNRTGYLFQKWRTDRLEKTVRVSSAAQPERPEIRTKPGETGDSEQLAEHG